MVERPQQALMTVCRTVAIVQARQGSTRLPGKVLMDLGGDTMLSRVVRRAARAQTVDELVVATSSNDQDDAIVAECARLGATCFRGVELDVLERYYTVATATHAEVVVRITADCPFIDPEVIDTVVRAFHRYAVDYASNTQQRSWPRGLDVEVFACAALERAFHEAQLPWQRTHVTPYFYQHPELFRLHAVVAAEDYSDFRWTVDTPEDLALARAIYQSLENCDDFSWRAALAVIAETPELAELNRRIRQKSLEDG